MSLKDLIKQRCPISLAEYMELCLGHPEYGYYQKKVPFGRAGDFVTAPEISQMFGELIGAYLIQSWYDQGSPAQFTLAELGPGRGTLMADIVRTAQKIAPDFLQATQIYLMETSPILRDLQQKTIPFDCHWVSCAKDLPNTPLFFVANEFFDALPIHQYISTGREWTERYIDLISDQFQFVTKPCDLSTQHMPASGSILELCPSVTSIMQQLVKRLTPVGAGVIIDYGYTHTMRDESGWISTFQAIHQHQYANPLENPGDYDLTAHVDFTALAYCAPFTKLQTQGEFLTELGIEHRANALFRATQNETIFTDMNRLISPEKMGTLFKVLSVYGNTK
jgi:SAM-dependent MidA family methyltransferase